jgi:hypothetical protein
MLTQESPVDKQNNFKKSFSDARRKNKYSFSECESGRIADTTRLLGLNSPFQTYVDKGILMPRYDIPNSSCMTTAKRRCHRLPYYVPTRPIGESTIADDLVYSSY